MRNALYGLALLVGAGLNLVGFIGLQWVSVLGFGRTGLQMAIENQQSLPAQLRLVSEQPLWTLWLVPLAGLFALLVGWRLLRAERDRRTLLTVLLFVVGLVALYPFWMTYNAWSVEVVQTTDLLASGFWLALAGNGLALVTALIASR